GMSHGAGFSPLRKDPGKCTANGGARLRRALTSNGRIRARRSLAPPFMVRVSGTFDVFPEGSWVFGVPGFSRSGRGEGRFGAAVHESDAGQRCVTRALRR